MRNPTCLCVLTILIFSISSVNAQKKLFQGKVIDSSSGNGLQGVSIKIKSAKGGTLSAADGTFKINVNEGDELVIGYIGYAVQTISTKNITTATIRLVTDATALSDIVVVGSRGAPRSATESPVPVDIININQMNQSTGRPDLMSQLNIAVPSFNYNKQSGADGTDAIDFANLRGLGFDQTLVLINGKRQHMSAFVNQLGTRGRGNSGTDLNAIPENSIDHIEILRDGASAQYGSDAIAGVINIILKKDIKHLNVTAGVSGYYDHKYNTLNNADKSQFYTGNWLDGKTVNAGLSYGLPIGKSGGFINFAGNFLSHGKTLRALPDTNVTANGKALTPNTWRRAFGDGAVTTIGGMVNGEIPLDEKNTKFYFFGGYNHKKSNVYAWTRNSYQPERFPTDEEGNIIYNEDIMKTASDGTIYYNPQEDVFIKDGSLALGVKGTFGKGYNWDLSNVTGKNDFHYYGHKTYNVSLLPLEKQWSKHDFDDGGFSFLQNTANLDVSKRFENVAAGLTTSAGAEYRYEKYKLYKGEEDSYIYGGAFFVIDGDTTSKRSGSQGYPGYQPSDEANAHRNVVGGYIDLALDVTDKWLIDGAARIENYSDFGFVNTYKLATRYKIASNFNLRASISTGFRAPSLQQINFSNTNTTITTVPGLGPTLFYTKLSPNYSPITRAAGIPQLKEEKSVNGSVGFTWKPFTGLTFTIDGYVVHVKNRIVGTGNFDESIPELAPFLEQYNVSSVSFFANAVNTTNTGLDIVADYSKRAGNGTLKVLLAGNFQHIKINDINIPPALSKSYANQQAFFSTREQYFLKASAPAAKFSFSLDYNIRNIGIGTRLTYFGKVITKGFGSASIPGAPAGGPGGAGISDQFNGWDPYVELDDGSGVTPESFIFNGKVSTDVYANYKFSKNIMLYAGVDNLFNIHPNQSVTNGARRNSWGDSESGGPFDSVQMGFNGIRFFSKLVFNF